MKAFLFLLVMLFSAQSIAISSGDFYLGAGYLGVNNLKSTEDDSGESTFLGESYISLLAQAHFDFFSTGYFISPLFLLTPQKNELGDGAGQTSVMRVALNFSKNLGDFSTDSAWSWNFGLGALFYKVEGEGGTVLISDGNTFARPGRTETSKFLTLDLGLSWNIFEKVQLSTEALVAGPFSGRRTFNFLVSLKFKIWGSSLGGGL